VTSTQNLETTVPDLVDEAKLQDLINSFAPNSTSSVYIIDKTNGVRYGTANSSNSSISSALINVAVIFTTLYEIDAGSINMQTPVQFSYNSGGRGILDSSFDGEEVSISQLLSSIFMYSDNNATNALISFLGGDTIENVCKQYGCNSVEINALIAFTDAYNENYISARDAAELIGIIWDDKFTYGKTFLVDNMRIQDAIANSGLSGGIGNNFDIMNHNGVRATLYNEVTIVSGSEETYIVVFMGDGSSQENLMNTAQQVGTYVFSCFNNGGF
ncbi:MAG: serine hydrolase, partial [Oscillospiraceae bacterium]